MSDAGAGCCRPKWQNGFLMAPTVALSEFRSGFVAVRCGRGSLDADDAGRA
jgi:hypothetical protein